MKKLLVLFVVIFVLLRIPSLFEPYWHGDEGITLTVGQSIANGAVLYQDITDNKTPILYFVAALSDTLFIFKLITLIVSTGALLTFMQVRTLLLGKTEYVSIVLFVLLAGTPLIEANIANAEIYMLLPTTLSILFYLKKQYVLAGVFGSLSFLLKPPGVMEMGALVVHAFFTNKKYWARIFKMAYGFFMPVVLIGLYFLLLGGFEPFIQEAFINNIFYTGSWRLLMDPKLWMVVKLVTLGIFLGFLYRSKKSYSSSELLIYLWLVFSLFGATLSNRPYPHYLIQIIPPVALLAGSIYLKKYHAPAATALLAAVLFFCIIQFRLHPGAFHYSYQYYTQFTNPLFFDQKVLVTEKVADHVLRNTAEGEPIFVWSDNSLIYAKTERPPATKYVSAYHITGNESREKEVIKTLTNNPPRLLVITQPIDHPFDALLEYAAMRYNLAVEDNQFRIYELKDTETL